MWTIKGLADNAIHHVCLKTFHYLINNAFNWMCVGSVTYSLVILLNRSTLSPEAYFFCHLCVFGVLDTQKPLTLSLLFFLSFFACSEINGSLVCCSLPAECSILHRERGNLENDGGRDRQPRFQVDAEAVLVRQIIWSETMCPEWQMIHFECDCTALREQTKSERGRENTHRE